MSEVVDRSPAVSATPVVDPVCGMSVPEDGTLRAEYAGRTYFFCSDGCLRRFQDEASAFVANERVPADDDTATSP